MSDSTKWPQITVCIVTYDRPDEIRRTLESLKQHLQYQGDLLWHLADDGSPDLYVESITQDFHDLKFSHTITERGGWGVNVNKALQTIQTDYVFLNEDDYVCLRDIDLSQGVVLMEQDKSVGLVRYDGIAAHVGLALRLKEIKDSSVERFDYFVIDRQRSSHLNCYSHRPHLKHRRFHDQHGLYDENLPLGETEEAYAHRIKHRKGPPHIAVLSDGIDRAFDHIGRSRQGSDLDPHKKE